MPAIILIGSQWGDEGKGKVTDFLAERSDVVVRSQGGNNAGHTVISEGEEYKLHLIPSGILNKDSLNVVGNGVVVDLAVLIDEMDQLKARSVSFDHFRISDRAHLIMPYHKLFAGLGDVFASHFVFPVRIRARKKAYLRGGAVAALAR